MEIVICFTGAIVKQIGRQFSLLETPFASVLVRINNRTGQPSLDEVRTFGELLNEATQLAQ